MNGLDAIAELARRAAAEQDALINNKVAPHFNREYFARAREIADSMGTPNPRRALAAAVIRQLVDEIERLYKDNR